MSDKPEHGGCPVCGRTDISLKKDGTLRSHVHANRRGTSFVAFSNANSSHCEGSGKLPNAPTADPHGEA